MITLTSFYRTNNILRGSKWTEHNIKRSRLCCIIMLQLSLKQAHTKSPKPDTKSQPLNFIKHFLQNTTCKNPSLIPITECLFTLSANSTPCWQRLFTLTPPTDVWLGESTLQKDASWLSVSVNALTKSDIQILRISWICNFGWRPGGYWFVRDETKFEQSI